MRRRVAAGLLLWLLTVAVLRVTLLAPERCPEVPPAAVDAAVARAVGWFSDNQLPDGRYRYAVTEEGEDLPGYSIVRHAGVLLSLHQAGADDVAEAGTAWARERLLRRDGWAALADAPNGRVPVGASALLVAALAHRADGGDPAGDDVLRALGRFLLVHQQPDGSVLATWDAATGEPVPGETSPFFTGETFWALTLLDERFPGEGWGKAAARTARYLATEREEAEGRYPLVPDHWGAYGLEEMGDLGPAEIAWARRLAGAFGLRVRFESQQRTQGPVALVRGGWSMGSAVGTLGEGLGGLWLLAGREPALHDLQPVLASRLACVAGLLVERQADDGAWYADGVTRMDDQQHAVSALLAARDVVTGA